MEPDIAITTNLGDYINGGSPIVTYDHEFPDSFVITHNTTRGNWWKKTEPFHKLKVIWKKVDFTKYDFTVFISDGKTLCTIPNSDPVEQSPHRLIFRFGMGTSLGTYWQNLYYTIFAVRKTEPQAFHRLIYLFDQITTATLPWMFETGTIVDLDDNNSCPNKYQVLFFKTIGSDVFGILGTTKMSERVEVGQIDDITFTQDSLSTENWNILCALNHAARENQTLNYSIRLYNPSPGVVQCHLCTESTRINDMGFNVCPQSHIHIPLCITCVADIIRQKNTVDPLDTSCPICQTDWTEHYYFHLTDKVSFARSSISTSLVLSPSIMTLSIPVYWNFIMKF